MDASSNENMSDENIQNPRQNKTIQLSAFSDINSQYVSATQERIDEYDFPESLLVK